MSMKQILIADDESHVIRILAQALKREGYAIRFVSNGEAALQQILEQPPDVLITDIQMPRMTGDELCRRIGEQLPDRRFLIFVLTSRTELEHRQWSRRFDNLVFLEKPLSVRRLITMLNDHFAHQDIATEGGHRCMSR